MQYNDLNIKYSQAKEHFSKYTKKFLETTGSGIVSNKKIRKINIISMWMDFIQKYMHNVKLDSNTSKDVSYDEVNSLLDLIASEFKIVYKTANEIEIENSLQSSKRSQERKINNVIESSTGNLTTEDGVDLEIEGERANNSSPSRPSMPSSSNKTY